MKPTSESFRNMWCAALVDEQWRFIDCHWGARHVDKSRVKTKTVQDGKFCYSLDEFFFLPDPENVIYMHFPDDPKWQLLQQPLTMDQFLDLPVLKSHFFQYKLKLMPDTCCNVVTHNGLVDVILRKLAQNGDTEPKQLLFNTRLETIDQSPINSGHTIHQNASAGVVFHVNLALPGEYIFTIFAKERDQNTDFYNNICSFRLISRCDALDRNIPSRFPIIPDGYGPLLAAAKVGIETESHRGFYLVTDKEKLILNVRFGCAVNLSQKYYKGGEMGESTDIDLSRHLFQRYRDVTRVSYLLRFPASGFYVLSLFAAPRDTQTTTTARDCSLDVHHSNATLECVCRYVIHCASQRADHTIKIYPKTLQNWLGCRLFEPTSGDLKVQLPGKA